MSFIHTQYHQDINQHFYNPNNHSSDTRSSEKSNVLAGKARFNELSLGDIRVPFIRNDKPEFESRSPASGHWRLLLRITSWNSSPSRSDDLVDTPIAISIGEVDGGVTIIYRNTPMERDELVSNIDTTKSSDPELDGINFVMIINLPKVAIDT
nr:unnamed protein product [Callosobruchus chinensis]